MARLVFANSLRRFVDCPPGEVAADTVRSALDGYFALHPGVRGYVLDDQGEVRHHVVVFNGGEPVCDRRGLSDRCGADTEIHVMQALSGG